MLRYLLLASVCSLASIQGSAQEAERTTIRQYTAEDFSQFAPRTARDMVGRIPGFSIEGDNDGSRGFGQATGNVLINGQRISGKSNSASDALSRIPIGNVQRIDVVDGATLDIPGLSGQVVDVIAKVDGVSGTWKWSSRFREDLPPYFDNIDVSATGNRGALTWTLGLESSPRRGGNGGFERIEDGDGNLIETRKEAFNFIGVVPSVNGSLNWKPANGHIANLNASYTLFEANETEFSRTFPVNGQEGRRVFNGSEDEWNSEVGGDYEIGLGPGRLKGIGLVRLEHSPTISSLRAGALDGSGAGQSIFEQTVDEGEYIARGEYSWAPREGRDWQVSLEGAFNELESEAAFSRSTDFGPLVNVPLDNPSTRVEEQRTELTVTHGRKLSPKLTMQASLGVEQSTLTQSGADGKERSFTRPKGFVSGSYAHDENTNLTAKFERRVGQLNFFDFISSVNVDQGNGREGNPEIVPDQAWRLELEAERNFGKWGALTVTAFGEDIEDIVDRIPIGTGDGPGNIDSAWRVGASIDGTLKLDPMGIKGAQIEFSGDMATSRVDDPVTGRSRRINNDHVSQTNFSFRHDIPKTEWAYGIAFENHRDGAFYRLDERGHGTNPPGYGYAFVEHKDIFGLTGKAIVGNLANQTDKFRREIFSPNRLGDLVRVEDRTRNFGPYLTLRLEGSF